MQHTESVMVYGFVGLGNIGLPMAERLVTGGLDTIVFDRRRDAGEAVGQKGARVASSVSHLAAGANVIGVCVRDDQDVCGVTLGEEGIIASASAGSVIAIHSTVLPATVIEVGRVAAERGIEVVDAQITGGAIGARNGTLIYMVGGESTALERCRPAFETSARAIVHCGALGSGAATKLCNNLMGYMNFLAAYEAGTLAKAAGISVDVLTEVTRSNGLMPETTATFLRHRLAMEDQSITAEREQALRSFTDLAEKDLALTLRFAEEQGIRLPATDLCKQLMARVYGVHELKQP